jgi:hypothetical protein
MPDWPIGGSDGQIMTSSTLTSTTYGVTLTASGSINTKGSWTEMHAAVPYDVSGVYVQVVTNLSGVGYVLDIGIGANPNETVIIPNIGWVTSRANYGGPHPFFPIAIAKGTRVSARIQATSASAQCIVNLLFLSSGFGSTPPFSRITPYGINLTGQPPTTIDPGGTANTKGSWVTLPPTTNYIRSLIMLLCMNNAAVTSALWTIDVGIGSTPQIVLADLAMRAETTMDEVTQQVHGPFPLSIPPGLDLKVRAKCSITDATDRLIRCALYGLD